MVKTKNAVVVKARQPGMVAVSLVGRSPIEIIQTAILAKNGTIENMKELLAFQKDWEANEAKKAYYKAMSQFKSELPQINRNRTVKYQAGSSSVQYAYATLFNAIDKVTPIMSKFGLSVAWFHAQTDKDLKVTCRITHELGYSEETSLTGQHDNTGSKNAIQALGSTNSYLERYTFFGLIGAAAKDADDDGKASSPVEYITDKELSQLVDCLTALKKTEKSFCALMKIPTLDKMPKDKYDLAMRTIKLEAERTGVKL